ncbi:hypothetical protein DLH72_00845 [Candidatus Gracilibacteria bacterium]|nr:MAG: hypothetical protein DLH72_00845 [Candidatus Gracilibacteria bacterium]
MKQKDKEIVDYIFSKNSKSKVRKAYFENDFLLFCFYYFPHEFLHALADFQIEYIENLEDGLNVFFVGFRECGKSMILTQYYVYCICYRKKRFIMHYNSEIEQAKSMLRDVVMILEENEKIIADFGYLYLPEGGRKQKDKKQKSISEFITENGIKVKAMSIGKSPRGQKFVYKGVTYRPDLIGFDDIDTNKNTKNSDIIEADINFILGEVFGGASAHTQFIFLGNVINDIGRVISLKNHFESDPKAGVKIFWIPIRQKGKITWDRFVATDKEAKEKNKNISDPREFFISLESRRRLQGTIGFNQNYNLIPYKKGQKVISLSMIQYYQNLPKNYKIVIGIDPAFSEKTNTDPIGITITAHEKYGKDNFYYIIESLSLEGEEKNYTKFVKIIKELYQKYKASGVIIENNNGGGILGDMLKRERLAVRIVSAKKDKVTRLTEYQGLFERGFIKFNSDLAYTGKLIEQLKEFPNADHDDMVDSMVYSFYLPNAKILIV